MWQPWVPHVDCVRLLELHGLTGIGAFVAACATGCAICRGWIATSCWPHHLSDERMALLSNKNPGISRVEAAGSFTSALASASGLSRTMAICRRLFGSGLVGPLAYLQESPPPCFRTECVPIPQGLFVPGCQFVVGPCELSASPVHE